jgi:hypothetical protein
LIPSVNLVRETRAMRNASADMLRSVSRYGNPVVLDDLMGDVMFWPDGIDLVSMRC